MLFRFYTCFLITIAKAHFIFYDCSHLSLALKAFQSKAVKQKFVYAYLEKSKN